MTALGPLWALLCGAALAGQDVVVTDGPLRPGRAATIELASTTEAGAPSAAPPKLVIDGAGVGELLDVRPGIWRAQLLPSLDAAAVEITVGSTHRTFPIAPPASSSLTVPAVVEATVRGDPPSFVVTGPETLPPDALEIVTSEGRVASTVPVAGGLAITLGLDDLPYPRWVAVGIRDRRRDEQPAWTSIRVHARPRIPLQAERGARLTVKIGSRTYGPFQAGPDGAIEGRVDQFPGDVVATAILVDDLGNENRTEIPLVTQSAPVLVALAMGELSPGRPPPLVWLRSLAPDGEAPAEAPTCRMPLAELPVRPIPDREGLHLLALPPILDPSDVRVACALGTTSIAFRVGVASGVPARLSLRVWPDELLADFPVAELSVVLDDTRGERLPVDGITVEAERGRVMMEPGEGIVLRGEYDGTAAIETTEDVVTARYRAPPGTGPLEELIVRFGPVPPGGGDLVVHTRAVDSLRRPLGGVPLVTRIGPSEVSATTTADGWASARVPFPAGRAPTAIEVSAGSQAARILVLPGEAAYGGPGTADLEVTEAVSISPGRVTGISIQVEPPILRAGPGAVAWVSVKLEDGAGQPVVDEPVEVEATEGVVGELHVRGDGTLVAEYTPLAADGSREIEITARTSTVRSTATLSIEPRVVRVSVGPWIGGQTNFGALLRPTAGIDVDLRVRSRLAGEAMILRLGASGSAFRSTAETEVGPPVDLRSTMLPLSAAVLLRQDRGPWAFWGGVGGMVGPHWMQVRFGDALVTEGLRLLLGPLVTAGAGVRAPGGEIVLTLQGSWLPATNDDVGYRGNLGGVSGGFGYRLVY